MTKILSNKNDMIKNFKKYEKEFHPSFAYSMNSKYIDKEISPKILIVGTITPEAGRGYYYTSPKNSIYLYLKESEIINEKDFSSINNLNDLPCEELDELSSSKRMSSKSYINNATTINEIKNKLESKEIYFFDVYSCVIRKTHNDPSDNNIAYGVLDCDAFKNINLKNTTKIIVNSKNAFDNFIKLLQINKTKFEGQIICLPQNARGFKKSEFSNKDIKSTWKEVLLCCLNNKKICFKNKIVNYPNETEWK